MKTFEEFLAEQNDGKYHVIKTTKDTTGTYTHLHSSHDSKEAATTEMEKAKKNPGSFKNHKVVSSRALARHIV